MKQIIYILLTTTMLGLMSCSDWLDVSPKTSIPTDKQFESESGFKDALTGIYWQDYIPIIRGIIQMLFSTKVSCSIMRTCF